MYDEISADSKFSSNYFTTIIDTMLQKGELGKFIKTAREKKKMSQEQIAKLLDESRSSYAEWEKETEPKASTFMRIAEILEFDPLEVFKDFKLSINKTGIVTSKIDSIQASLDELKALFNSGTRQSPSGNSSKTHRPRTFGKRPYPDKSKDVDQVSPPDNTRAAGNKNKE